MLNRKGVDFMKKPIIGISGNIITDSSGNFAGYHRAYVNDDYIDSVVQNGGIPLMIPLNEDKEIAREQVQAVDAILLSGGQDVSPLNYNEEPSPKLGETFPQRDQFDFQLIQYAMEENKPILGICRGIQVINTYFGGSLYQDLSDFENKVIMHNQAKNPQLPTHTVTIERNSKLFEIFKEEKLLTNSFHHQAVKEVGKGLAVTARTSDGIIEAIEHRDYPFLIAIQWHPEMLHKSVAKMNLIFSALIVTAGGKKDE